VVAAAENVATSLGPQGHVDYEAVVTGWCSQRFPPSPPLVPCSLTQAPSIFGLCHMEKLISSFVFAIAFLTKFKWDRFLPCDFDPERDTANLHGKVAIITGAK
jgi:hypothetical protein